MFMSIHVSLIASSQPSLGGTYQGIEPLGPIWSMTSTSTRIPFGALEQDHGPDRPLNIKFSLLNGHVGHNQTRDDIMSDDCDITRGFMAGNIQRTPFKEGPMEGMLYAPTDRGKQVSVITNYIAIKTIGNLLVF